MESVMVKWTGRSIYKSDTDDYTVGLYRTLDIPGDIICTGNSLPETKGIIFIFDGDYKITSRGKHFQVSSFCTNIQQNEADIISFLCSGAVNGIGKISAKRIYDTFGDKTFSVLRTTPEELCKVKGISRTKLMKILNGLKEIFSNFDIYDFLHSHNCAWATPDIIAKIMTAIQKQTDAKNDGQKIGEPIKLISENPYWLLRIHGIDFFEADQLAKSLGFPMDSEARFRAASLYVLMQQELSGHCGMDLQAFGCELLNLMEAPGIDPAIINEGICNLLKLPDPPIKYKALRTDGRDFRYIYRTHTYETESRVYDLVVRFSKRPISPLDINFEWILADIEKSQNITLSNSQREAVHTSLVNPISVITGFPGTGKTTVLKTIAECYERTHKGAKILMLAPTGRAARRMAESTGYPASTIHKRLMLLGEVSELNAECSLNRITEDLMIVDETSMLDIFVARHLLANTSLNTKIIFVGDTDQLPSVNAGAFLRDLVTSGIVPCITLNTFFRQSIGSVLANAHKIHNGDVNLMTDEHFEIYDHLQDEKLEDKMLSAYLQAVNIYGIQNVVCLCPVKDYAAGVDSMNKRIQDAINPASPNKAEVSYCGVTYRVGDLVMGLKNGTDVMNGDIGRIAVIMETVNDIDAGKKEIEVEVHFGKENSSDMISVVYEKAELDELALAYAMTVHKSQGSEYACVITCLQDINKKMQVRNLIYTAITRAKNDVRFFGSRTALSNAILHDVSDERNTLLGHYLKHAAGKVKEYRSANYFIA